MSNASIQITQGATVIPAGRSALGFDKTTTVTLTDAAGAGAVSYAWSVVSFPGPLGSAPSVTNSTQQVASISGPFTDGVYIVKLIRTDISGTTVDIRYFGVADDDGLHLPSPGMTGTMSNIGGSSAAQAAGWGGRADASTNVLLDAYLRWLKTREGIYEGKVSSITVSDATSSPQALSTATGIGVYDITYTKTSAHTIRLIPSLTGEVLEFLVRMDSVTGSLTFQSDTAGPTLVTLTSPPAGAGSLIWRVKAGYNGAYWVLKGVEIVDVKTARVDKEFQAVTGIQSASVNVYTRVGTVLIDPSKYPTSKVTFQAVLEATAGQTAVCQLYNVTDGSAVSGSVLTGTSTTPTVYEATITIPNSSKLYEVQLKLGAVNGGTDRASCTNAKIFLTWG